SEGDGGDVDVDGDFDVDSDVAFELISINSLTAFFMMFGWIGLSCYKQFSLNSALSILIATAAGICCMLITAFLFRVAKKLVSQGVKFNIADTVGKVASVYLKIPTQGKGKIQISINDGMTRELAAISKDHEEIDSFQSVEIVEVIDANTVAVKKIN
ncbi:hypothetical protein ACFLQ1_02255, partial [Candidatus Auribacterota bacterium]